MLSVSNSHENKDAERELLLSLKNKIQGIVLYASSSVDNIDLFEKMLMENYPIIFIDRYPFNLPCSSIACDNFEGGYRIGKLFVERGHRRVAFIFHNLSSLSSERDRFNGFMKALAEGNVSRNDISTMSISGYDTLEAVDHIMANLYKNKDTAPTAIFAVNDHLALVVRQYLNKHAEHEPKDILLAGFDDLIGDKLDSPFVTIRQNYKLIGRTAAEMLVDKIENRSYLADNCVIPIEFIRYNV
jgi:LacI family transcriptional regulator